MPSDCQCSTPQEIIVERKVVLNNKQATARLRKLEKEVKALRRENSGLKTRLTKATAKKADIIKSLKSHLNRV